MRIRANIIGVRASILRIKKKLQKLDKLYLYIYIINMHVVHVIPVHTHTHTRAASTSECILAKDKRTDAHGHTLTGTHHAHTNPNMYRAL